MGNNLEFKKLEDIYFSPPRPCFYKILLNIMRIFGHIRR